eukprot:6193485-Pleurochrysis_carterae.AAC.3
MFRASPAEWRLRELFVRSCTPARKRVACVNASLVSPAVRRAADSGRLLAVGAARADVGRVGRQRDGAELAAADAPQVGQRRSRRRAPPRVPLSHTARRPRKGRGGALFGLQAPCAPSWRWSSGSRLATMLIHLFFAWPAELTLEVLSD